MDNNYHRNDKVATEIENTAMTNAEQLGTGARALSTLSTGLAKKIVLAVCALALVAVSALALSGCKPPVGQLAANAAIAEMAAIEKHDPESLEFLVEVSEAQQLEQIGISQQEFFEWWLDGYQYSLGDLEMNNEETEAQINAKITCRQLEPIIKTWSNEYVEWLVSNEAAIRSGQIQDPCAYGRDLLRSKFESTEPTLVETTVTVRLYDEDWSVTPDMQNGIYRDALLGSTDNLEGYYFAPIEELGDLGIELPITYQVDVDANLSEGE